MIKKRLNELYLKLHISYFLSLIGTFILLVIQIYLFIIDTSLFYVSSVFYFLIIFIVKVVSGVHKFYAKTPLERAHVLLIGEGISIVALPITLLFALLYKNSTLPYSWAIYIYALYGLIKLNVAIKRKIKPNENIYYDILNNISIQSSLYTISMMILAILQYFDKSEDLIVLILILFIIANFISIIVLVQGVKQYFRLKKGDII